MDVSIKPLTVPGPGDFAALADNLPQLAWIAEADGHIFWYNKRWLDYTGLSMEELSGWGWQSVHDPAVLPAVLEEWRASLASGHRLKWSFRLRGRTGSSERF